MTAQPFVLYVGDREPAVTWTVTDSDGEPQDLTGWSIVSVKLRNVHTGAVVTGAGTVVFNEERSTGLVTYEWAAADTLVAGEYVVTVRFDTTGAGVYATLEWERPLTIRPFPS